MKTENADFPYLPLHKEHEIHPAPGRGNPSRLEWWGLKKKGQWERSWIRIDNKGTVKVLDVDKVTILRMCGLPARDLRLLDPLFVYPATILGREKAIVVNLEHIRCIIMAEEALVLNATDDYVLQYVIELQRRLSDVQELESSKLGASKSACEERDFASTDQNGKFDYYWSNALPFEFNALEVALEAACSFLNSQAAELEEEAYPLLDELTSKISPIHLENVRRLKSKLAGLLCRVQKVRDEIQQLMDDDEDMVEMYLSEKKNQTNATDQRYRNSQSLCSRCADVSVSGPVSPANSPEIPHKLERLLSSGKRLCRNTSSLHGSSTVDELEMLLEAYFVVADVTVNRLTSLKGYIDHTEELIDIQLDDVRNQLIQFELLLTCATLIIGVFGVVAGVFGMNFKISIFKSPWAFKWVLIISGVLGLIAFFCFVLYFRSRGLMSL